MALASRDSSFFTCPSPSVTSPAAAPPLLIESSTAVEWSNSGTTIRLPCSSSISFGVFSGWRIPKVIKRSYIPRTPARAPAQARPGKAAAPPPIYTLVLMIMAIILLALSFAVVLPLFLGVPALVPVLGFRGMYDRLITFGIRQPEKTPKEIELEQAAGLLCRSSTILRRMMT